MPEHRYSRCCPSCRWSLSSVLASVPTLVPLQPFDRNSNRNMHHENEISKSSVYHRGKFPAVATSFSQQLSFPHHASPSYEHQCLVSLFLVMVQQQLINLQTTALREALFHRLHKFCHSFSLIDVFGERSNLYPIFTATNYLFGSIGNSKE